MPYITTPERVGFKRGMATGMEKGMATGMEKGMEKGISLSLELKFGVSGFSVIDKALDYANKKGFNALKEAIKNSATLNELKAVLG
jgi:hypothetical protein